MTSNDSARACPKCGTVVPADAPQGLCPKCVLACAAMSAEVLRSATATGEIPSLERVAAAFPSLEVVELVGRGAMGFVFKARQPHLDRFVALKLLPDQLARDPQFAERFNREGRVLAKLNHPNIVSVFDFGRTEHFYFLLMEFVDGVNLRQAMQAGRFSPAEALAIVPKICEALQYAHEQGVLHRDIKPENILLDAKGRVKIADFGIAKLVGEDRPSVTLTGTGAALGTPHYMAPEQLEKPSEVDHRADVYSLGVVFYEMLTGELPIGRFAPPSAKTPVNANVDEVVFRTLEKDREKRYQSAGEVKTQVEHLTENGVVAAPTVPGPGAPVGPHGTRVVAPVEKPRFAFRAFAGAALVGMSLVRPLTVLVALVTGRGGIAPAELWLSLGSVALLGLGGTLVGWLALNEIRDGRGAVRGLPLALFATLTWPLLALVCVTVGMPMFLLKLAGGSGGAHWLGRVLVLALPAGTLTFALWAVYATARWASQQPKAHERGVLKWVFAGLLVCGFGLVLVSKLADGRSGRMPRTPSNQPDAAATVRFTEHASQPVAEASEFRPFIHGRSAVEVGPQGLVGTGTNWTSLFRTSPLAPGQDPASLAHWIRFTFTAVELREDAQGRWLALDYVDDVHGDCETSVRRESTLSAFTPQTRTTAFRTDAKDGSLAVRHQRVEFLLPDEMDRADLLRFRDELAKGLVAKSRVAHAGEEFPVFTLPVRDRGTLDGWMGARTRTETPPVREPLAGQATAAVTAAAGDVQARLAEARLAEMRKRFEAGQATGLDVSEAERDLAIANARGDALLITGAKLKHAELNLETARKQFEVGVLTRLEFQTAEAERDVAKIQYDEAIGGRIPTPQQDEATRAAAAERLHSAQLRLKEIRKEIEVGALPPQGREILEADAEVGIAEARVRGDVLAAAKVRSEYAGRMRVLVEKLREVGKATAEELDQAKLNEVQANAALTALEDSR